MTLQKERKQDKRARMWKSVARGGVQSDRSGAWEAGRITMPLTERMQKFGKEDNVMF